MPFKNSETTTCDVLVIGSGGAGLRAAIAAAERGRDTLIMSKARIGHATNTYLSKAIVASSGWGDSRDAAAVHADDTIRGGRHLNNPRMVARFTEAIRAETARLREWGVAFSVDENGHPRLGKVPGHSYARHLHGRHYSGGDLVLPLIRKARETGVRFQEHTFAFSLLVSDGGVRGATGIAADGTFLAVRAGAVVIATGGFGQVFLNTNNAPGIAGDGLALALEAGVPLQDMEFVQFYPTAYGKRGGRILLYEHFLAQEGVALKNSRGVDFLAANGHDPASITRDALAQVIMKEILSDPQQKGSVDMDLRALSDAAAKSLSPLLPGAWAKGQRVFQVKPTTHFCMGGIVTDPNCGASCPGLFAVGEATAGSHGANRLGGNSLAEVIAMGSVAGMAAADSVSTLASVPEIDGAADREKERLAAMADRTGPSAGELIREIKRIMWHGAGIIRDRQSLEMALGKILELQDVQSSVKNPPDLIKCLEFENMRLIGEVVCRAALERKESRGAHFRSDYPETNDQQWRMNIRIWRKGAALQTECIPVDGPIDDRSRTPRCL